MVIWHFLVSFGACLLVGLLVAFDVYIEELSLATLGKPTGTEREEKRWGVIGIQEDWDFILESKKGYLLTGFLSAPFIAWNDWSEN